MTMNVNCITLIIARAVVLCEVLNYLHITNNNTSNDQYSTVKENQTWERCCIAEGQR